MADRSITVKIGANVTGFVSAMKTAAKATEDAGARTRSWVSEHETAINDVSNMALGMGAALVAGAGTAVVAFANFDAAMSSVQAATMETAENMDMLREAAIQAGADTQYSAT
ncbi:TPA: hypothetical protein OQU49_004488, partial [Shigella flexneri]|nr:hypothetical protein [Shigella flexneri]